MRDCIEIWTDVPETGIDEALKSSRLARIAIP